MGEERPAADLEGGLLETAHQLKTGGTGESDLTWQASGDIGYRYKQMDSVVAYRYLSWELKDNKIFDDYSMHGPLAGIRFRF